MEFLKKIFKNKLPGFYVLAGSFFVAAGWSWYHFNKHDKAAFISKATLLMLLLFSFFYVFRKLFLITLMKTNCQEFWKNAFCNKLEELFLLCSLFFLVFFIKVEIYALLYSVLFLLSFFYFLQKVLLLHPNEEWKNVSNSTSRIIISVFIIEGIFQYLAYKFYILDNNVRFYNIVLFRSIAVSLFWVFLFFVSYLISRLLGGWKGRIVFSLWLLLFAFVHLLWMGNIGVLYYSGLYLSPTAIFHFEGAGGVLKNHLTLTLVLILLVAAPIIYFLISKSIKIFNGSKIKIIAYFTTVITAVFILAFFGLSSFKNTPEAVISKSFYNYYFSNNEAPVLDMATKDKLKKFGLNYNENEFFVNSRSKIFSGDEISSAEFGKTTPNIVIVLLESFSSRLSDVYGSKFLNITPNLKNFSQDPNTVVFKNFYNGSTPTITGSLSLLCSFLPTTGHEEIQNERKLQNHHLQCLPEVLKKELGFNYTAYITSVDKSYANKEGIFKSMGMDDVFGLKELKKKINETPLSWGYSDHQTFSLMWQMMQKQSEPFLMMLATVDTHPPFNLAKDAVNYEDGSRPVLNMFHTTDHAFGLFWEQFKKSRFYENTIVVAVADHAIFPGALTTDLFKEEAKTLSYYDENFFAAYIPGNKLPKEVNVYSSSIDFTPTMLHILNVNIPNSFEGYSIFDERNRYPNLLGMHEFGLYINQEVEGGRKIDYNIPTEINCPENYDPSTVEELTLCDYKRFYEWKRKMFEEGRFWKH